MATLIGGSPMPAISPDLPCTANGTRSRLKTGITITAPRAGQNSLNSRVQTFYMRDMRQGPTTRKGLRIGGSARPASPTSKQPSAGPQPRTISELFSSLLGALGGVPGTAEGLRRAALTLPRKWLETPDKSEGALTWAGFAVSRRPRRPTPAKREAALTKWPSSMKSGVFSEFGLAT